MKARKNILYVILLIIYLVSVSGMMSNKEKNLHIKHVRINITDSIDNQFIHSADVRKLLDRNKLYFTGKEYDLVNLETIELLLKNQQIVEKAEAFITEPGILHVEVSQKDPFVRIFNASGKGYYLDRKGNIIPLSPGFSPYLLVASGYISEPFIISKTLNIYDVEYDSLSFTQKTIYDIYLLASYITQHPFWNAQIEQIYVNSNREYELIPRVGSQIIEFGNIESMEEKFEKLRILYLNGFNNLGWNNYSKINLKYKNQVVCTKTN